MDPQTCPRNIEKCKFLLTLPWVSDLFSHSAVCRRHERANVHLCLARGTDSVLYTLGLRSEFLRCGDSSFGFRGKFNFLRSHSSACVWKFVRCAGSGFTRNVKS